MLSAQERAARAGPDGGLGGRRAHGPLPTEAPPPTAPLEVAHQHHRVLLHVEDHRQIRAAGEGQLARAGSPLCRPSCQPLTCVLCFKKRLKAAEAESKLKQVYIPN